MHRMGENLRNPVSTSLPDRFPRELLPFALPLAQSRMAFTGRATDRARLDMDYLAADAGGYSITPQLIDRLHYAV
jgi:hypothetical protein